MYLKLEDIYASRDFPVLLAVGRWEREGKPGGYLDIERLERRSPEMAALGRNELVQAVERLEDMLRLKNESTKDGADYWIRGLTPAGLKASGLWSAEKDLAGLLEQLLESRARELEKVDPEKSSRLREVLGGLQSMGTEFMAKLVAELLARAAGKV